MVSNDEIKKRLGAKKGGVNPDDSKKELTNAIYLQMEKPRLFDKSQNPLDKICNNCGHQNHLMSIFCEECGEKLPSIENAYKKTPKESSNNSLKHSQDTPEALLSKAASIKNPNEFDKAVKYFDEALKLNPDTHTKSLILYNKGLKLKKMSGKDSEANECLKEFIEIAPSNLEGSINIAKQLIQGKDINQIYKNQRNNLSNNQSIGLSSRRFNIQIRETTIGTFGHHQEKFDKAIAEVSSDELRITKKGIWTGRERGNITLKYLDIISLDEDRGWVLTTVQIRMAGNHTVNLRFNKDVMRIFFNVLKQAVDSCKERERQRITKASQIENKPLKHANNTSEDPVEKLVKLAKLLEDGLIDENEFARLKTKLLEKDS